jgi:hypothetical protein
LSLDFSAVNRDPNPEVAKAGLFNMINNAIVKFYTKYVNYLNNAITQYRLFFAEPLIDANNAISSLQQCVNIVEVTLNQVPKGDTKHPLAGVKGVTI